MKDEKDEDMKEEVSEVVEEEVEEAVNPLATELKETKAALDTVRAELNEVNLLTRLEREKTEKNGKRHFKRSYR